MNLDPRALIAGGIALAVVASGITWAIQHSRLAQLEQTLKTYEQSKDWDLSKVLGEIRGASDTLSKQLSDMPKLDSLKKQNAELQQSLNNAQREAAELRTQLREARAGLRRAAPQKPMPRR